MKNQEKLNEFYNCLSPKIKSIISQVIKAEGEGQYRIKARIREIVEKEAQRRET